MAKSTTTTNTNKNSNLNRSGLVLFNKEYEIYFLNRIKPYIIDNDNNDNSNNNFDEKTNKFRNYVEKYCVPRGVKTSNESFLECAVREFMEETNIFFNEVIILKDHFLLEWYDPPNVLWQYKIFVGFVDDLTRFSVRYCDKKKIVEQFKNNWDQVDESSTTAQNYIKVSNIKSLCSKSTKYKYSNENVVLLKKNFNRYKDLVCQNLHFYHKHNYYNFFTFLENMTFKKI